MSNSPVPVFILGSGRSGTTVTASLMNRLPGVHIAKETGFIGQSVELLRDLANANSRQKLIDVVNSWLVVEKWLGRASEQGFDDFCQQHQFRGASAFIHYVWQIDSPTPWEQLSFIGDNTPLYVLSIPWLLELFPDAKFVHVVRDPRDVVCSVMSMRFGADDPIVAAMEWQHSLGCWLMAERMVSPANRIEIRYEDLCMSSTSTLRKLAEWLSPEMQRLDLEYLTSVNQAPRRDTFQNVAELPHHRRLQEPLNANRIGRFRTELTEKDIARIEAVLQNGMLACGYQPSTWQVSPYATEDRVSQARAMIRDLLKRSIRRLTKRRSS
jgi:hypothetical protein